MTSFYRKSANRDSITSIITSGSIGKDEKREHHLLHLHLTSTDDDDDDALTPLSVNKNALQIVKTRTSMIPVPTKNKDEQKDLAQPPQKAEEKQVHHKRVSDIISRLSSSTASSRAKQLEKNTSRPLKRSPVIRNNSTFKSPNSPDDSVSATNVKSPAPPKSSASSIPRVSSPSLRARTVIMKRPSTPLRQRPSTPMKNRPNAPLRPVNTPLKRPNTPLRNRPMSPLRNRPMSLSKPRTMTPVKRQVLPNKTARLVSIPAQDLTSKITELESVLSQERSKCDIAYEKMERVLCLEQLLEKERKQNALLQERIRKLEQAGEGSVDAKENLDNNDSKRASCAADSSEVSLTIKTTSCNNMAVAPTPSQIDYKQQYQDLQALFNTQLVQFQNIITGLKVQKETLLEKNCALTAEVDTLRASLQDHQTKIESLEKEINTSNNRQSKAVSNGLKLKTSIKDLRNSAAKGLKKSTDDSKASKVSKDSKLLEELEQKKTEINNLNTTITTLKNQADLYLTTIKNLEQEVEQLNSKIQRDSWSYSKQNNIYQRELRRKNFAIVALETSLQDVKISLQEKEMENDELQNSIIKLMERTKLDSQNQQEFQC